MSVQEIESDSSPRATMLVTAELPLQPTMLVFKCFEKQWENTYHRSCTGDIDLPSLRKLIGLVDKSPLSEMKFYLTTAFARGVGAGCWARVARAMFRAPSRVRCPPMKPLAWTKMQPGIPLTWSRASSRSPRHGSGRGSLYLRTNRGIRVADSQQC